MSDPSVDECHLRQVMLEKSRQKYLLCDSSKLHKTYFYDMGNISQLDGVISDQPLPPELLRRIKA
jgi:DeoR/GlpR family transcriptional regulator of sugar metabolism